jgi:hypothetical protein
LSKLTTKRAKPSKPTERNKYLPLKFYQSMYFICPTKVVSFYFWCLFGA